MRLNVLRKTIRADLDIGSERGKLVRSAGATAGLKIGSTLLAFGASLLYARVLGPHDYGLYAYVIAWATVLTIPASLGLPEYLVREESRTHRLCWLRRWADKRVLLSGLAAAALLCCAFFMPRAAGARWLFVIAAPLPLLNNLGAVRRAFLLAHGAIARSQWPVLLLGPLLTLMALALLWIGRGRLSSWEIVTATVGAAAIVAVISELQLNRIAAPISVDRDASIRIRAALPFMWLGMLYLLNSRIDLLMLGSIKGARAAGIYSVASRAAELVTFFLAAANMTLAPRVARLHQEGQHQLLQRLLTAAARRILALSIPIAVLFIVAAHPLLTLLYGTRYAQGAIVLQVLAAAQFVNVVAGSTGLILNMTGNERLTAIGVGASVVLNIILNAVLIPYYAVAGAAVATACSLVAWNILLWWWIRRRLGLQSTAFPI